MSMKLNLSVDEVLATTRAVRKRLDFDKPVEPEVIKECLEAAIQSPTGSNLQGWQWMIVTDPEKRAGLAELYQRGWEQYVTMDGAANNLDVTADRAAQQERVVDSATYLAENFEKVPVMMIPILPEHGYEPVVAAERRRDGDDVVHRGGAPVFGGESVVDRHHRAAGSLRDRHRDEGVGHR